MKKILLIIPILLLFSGCTDFKELNDLAIVTGLSIDIEKNEYKASVLISNSQKADESNKEGDAGTVVYDGTGKSLSEALKNIDAKIPKQLYFGHLSVVIVSKDTAEKGIDNIADYLFRNPETTKQFYLIMTKDEDKASDVLKILSPLEEFPSQNIKFNIENADERTAISVAITYSDFIDKYLKKGIEPYLPTLKINGDTKKASSSKSLENIKPEGVVSLEELALFKDSKLVGYASKDESRGINLINGTVNEMIITTKCDKENYLVTALSDIKIKKKISFKNNKPNYAITLKAKGDIQEVNCDLNLYDKAVFENINIKVENKVKELMNSGIKRSQTENTDILGFGNLLYKKNPTYFKEIPSWNNEFSNIKINLNVHIDLKTKGAIKQSIKAAKEYE